MTKRKKIKPRIRRKIRPEGHHKNSSPEWRGVFDMATGKRLGWIKTQGKNVLEAVK